MRLLCVTDLHGDQRILRAILRDAGAVDGILLGGDLTNFGTPNQAEDLVGLARASCPLVMAVAGNCDSEDIDARLVELGVSLHRRGAVHQGIGFCGVSAMPPWIGNMYELTEEEIRDALQAGSRQIEKTGRRVVLSHSPPRDSQLDLTRGGAHVGSFALRQFMARQRPALVVCGHIHEARGVEQLEATSAVNCGAAFQGHYALATLHAAETAGSPSEREGDTSARHINEPPPYSLSPGEDTNEEVALSPRSKTRVAIALRTVTS